MRFLLDTHTFIWWDSAPNNLSERARRLLQNGDNRLVLSVVSVWEMQIKQHIVKLTLARSLSELVSEQREVNGIEVLAVSLSHVLYLDALPLHHNDPFDRLLLAQASVEDLPLVSRDAAFVAYEQEVVW